MRIERYHYGLHSPSQFIDLRIPEGPGPYPVIMLIHGGFWRAEYDLGLMDPMAYDLTHRGFATLNLEYRRTGEAGGGWPGTLLDIVDALNYLPNLASGEPLDLSRLTLLGHSAGGHLALWVAGQHNMGSVSPLSGSSLNLPIHRVISLAGVTDLLAMHQVLHGAAPVGDLMGLSPEEDPDRYRDASPIALLPLGVPQVLIHGTEDNRVPIEQSRAYRNRAQELGDPIQLIELQGVDHFQIITPGTSAWDTVASALLE